MEKVESQVGKLFCFNIFFCQSILLCVCIERRTCVFWDFLFTLRHFVGIKKKPNKIKNILTSPRHHDIVVVFVWRDMVRNARTISCHIHSKKTPIHDKQKNRRVKDSNPTDGLGLWQINNQLLLHSFWDFINFQTIAELTKHTHTT